MAKQTVSKKTTKTKITFSNPLKKSNSSKSQKRCPTCGKYMGNSR